MSGRSPCRHARSALRAHVDQKTLPSTLKVHMTLHMPTGDAGSAYKVLSLCRRGPSSLAPRTVAVGRVEFTRISEIILQERPWRHQRDCQRERYSVTAIHMSWLQRLEQKHSATTFQCSRCARRIRATAKVQGTPPLLLDLARLTLFQMFA